MSLAGLLSRFALSGPIDAGAMAVLECSMLDWVACGLAGANEPVAGIVRGLAHDEAGAEIATMFGGGKVPPRAAALVNGTTSHALDYDDTHFAHVGHPSVAILPAALAMAERQGAGYRDFAEAALLGAEASVRFGVWLGRAHYTAGYHQTATAGAIGATLAAGRLAGLSEAELVQALGIVSTRASGLKSAFGTMAKPYNAGIAAANGVEAVLLAARGMVANESGLDGPQGFGPTHAGAGADAAFDGLGASWLIRDVSLKFHACCHGLHAMLEAIAKSATGEGPVEKVSVVAHPCWQAVCNIDAPASGLEAKFSFKMAAAYALAGRSTAALGTFSDASVHDPDLNALRSRVEVSFDDALAETGARVEIRYPNHVRQADADIGQPMAVAERRDRVVAKATSLVGGETAASIDRAISTQDLSALLAIIGD